jgi:hypothetical protein
LTEAIPQGGVKVEGRGDGLDLLPQLDQGGAIARSLHFCFFVPDNFFKDVARLTIGAGSLIAEGVGVDGRTGVNATNFHRLIEEAMGNGSDPPLPPLFKGGIFCTFLRGIFCTFLRGIFCTFLRGILCTFLREIFCTS